MMVITFCGHSDYIGNLTDEEFLLNLLEEIIQGNEVDFYLGGYDGFDNFVLKCTKKYKQKHLNAKLIFITPYLHKLTSQSDNIIEKSYDMIIYPELERIPQKLAIIKRNEWMIKQADYVFAYVRRHYGGAYRTLLYAHKQKKPYINLYKGKYELY